MDFGPEARGGAPVQKTLSLARAPSGALGRAGRILGKLALAGVGLLLFVLALQMLKTGSRDYGKLVMASLDVSNPVDALGFGWLLAYVFLSGSPVAAVAVSFLAAETIDVLQAFTMITGSRLGASFIVLFVGFLYHLRGHERGASVSIGVLALLTTAAIYLPAMALGYALLQTDLLLTLKVSPAGEMNGVLDRLTDPALAWIKGALPTWALLPLGLVAMLSAFRLLDLALPQVSAEGRTLHRVGRLIYRPAAMFLVGAAVTTVTLSVSVSLSVLVPLSTRGLIRRENAIPYIMGANITTFVDTLFVALVAGGPEAFGIVLVEMVSVAVLSLLVLGLCYRQFEEALTCTQTWIVQDNVRLMAFLALMLVIPLALLAF